MSNDSVRIRSELRIARRLTLSGKIQGIGLRPAVARFATQLGLFGQVANTLNGVEVFVEGSSESVEAFQRDYLRHLPAAAVVALVQSEETRVVGFNAFRILGGKPAAPTSSRSSDSTKDKPPPLAAVVPPDVVVCRPCMTEVRNSGDLRAGYPFTSCADCGPRFSLITAMPYERDRTGMAGFPMCETCSNEYLDISDRRFHAQSIACPNCGPQIWLRGPQDQILARREAAISAAANALRAGKILAIRGLGGYQLLVDAQSDIAVMRLRRRKRRHAKPLAVMTASVHDALKMASLSEEEKREFCSPAGPIVVATVRSDARLATAIRNGLNTIGLMAPTTPLHALLLDAFSGPVVCTSGNVDSNPLVFQSRRALAELAGIADLWLEHDRPIANPIDDSVVRVIGSRATTLRMARGYAPLSLPIKTEQPWVALGGQQKSAFAISNSAQAILGAHVGDLQTVATGERYFEQLKKLTDLCGMGDTNLVCDEHPDYTMTQWAERQPNRRCRVQHHHAHIVAGMLEQGWTERQVIGVAFDGVGFGADGAVWGGEFFARKQH